MSADIVVLIEDDDWFAQQQTRVLTAAGYKVHRVSNGLSGIEAIDTHRPSVVVLDVFLPGPNAFVLLHELQSHADLSNIPIVMCTGSADQVLPEDVSKYGVRRIVDKTTMQPGSLVSAVKKVLL